jgi:hypothetical protein
MSVPIDSRVSVRSKSINLTLLPRVVQREALTVQRYRHRSNGSCYDVTALFYVVTRC